MKGLSSKFIELFTRKPKFDKRAGIHHNGVDNNYPELVESGIANSVTARSCASLMASYLVGKGFGELENKIIVNKRKNTSLLQFSSDIAASLSEQNGVFIQVNYNGAYQITDMDVIPFPDCRIGITDGDKHTAKIFVCSDWTDTKKAKAAKSVDVFNPKHSVIKSQIDNAGGIKKYNGQILYFRFGKYHYPLSPLHPCLDDASSEREAAVYKNTSLRKGFFGKTLVVTKPLVEADKETEFKEWTAQDDERTAFRETLQKFVGAENADGLLHIEMEFEGDNIDKEILFKNIDSNINDKLFAHTENSVKDNIRMCFKNVPAALIMSQDGKLFGNSGESIKAMKEFYQEQTENERMMINEIVNTLMKHFTENQEGLKIIPLVKVQKKKEDADQ